MFWNLLDLNVMNQPIECLFDHLSSCLYNWSNWHIQWILWWCLLILSYFYFWSISKAYRTSSKNRVRQSCITDLHVPIPFTFTLEFFPYICPLPPCKSCYNSIKALLSFATWFMALEVFWGYCNHKQNVFF
jgi:hypothetical protein